MAGLKPHVSKELAFNFLMAARPFMTAGDKDGVGYAAMGEDGIWGERWMDPIEAWSKDSRKPFTVKDEEVRKNFKNSLEHEVKYNFFGKRATPETTTAIIYHSRAATCEKTIENTHPFVRDNTAMIHNGVIRNHDALKKIYSTCDSEVILNQYVDMDVTNDIDKIAEMTPTIVGSYGCAILTIDKNKKRWLDIFRDTSSLYALYVKELETTVFCTSSEIVKDTCKKLGWTYGHVFKVKEDVLTRIDCDTGKVAFTRDFKTHWTAGSGGGSAAAGGEWSTGRHSQQQTNSNACGNTAEENDYEYGYVYNTSEEKKTLPPLALIQAQEEMEYWRTTQ